MAKEESWIANMPDPIWNDRMAAIRELGVEGAFAQSLRLDEEERNRSKIRDQQFVENHKYSAALKDPTCPMLNITRDSYGLFTAVYAAAQYLAEEVAQIIVVTETNHGSFLTHNDRYTDRTYYYSQASSSAPDAVYGIKQDHYSRPILLLIENLYYIHKKWDGEDQANLMRKLEDGRKLNLRVVAGSPSNPQTDLFNLFEQ